MSPHLGLLRSLGGEDACLLPRLEFDAWDLPGRTGALTLKVVLWLPQAHHAICPSWINKGNENVYVRVVSSLARCRYLDVFVTHLVCFRGWWHEFKEWRGNKELPPRLHSQDPIRRRPTLDIFFFILQVIGFCLSAFSFTEFKKGQHSESGSFITILHLSFFLQTIHVG